MGKIWGDNLYNSKKLTVQICLAVEIKKRGRACSTHVKNLIAIFDVKMTVGTLRLRRLEFIIKMANRFCILTNKIH